MNEGELTYRHLPRHFQVSSLTKGCYERTSRLMQKYSSAQQRERRVGVDFLGVSPKCQEEK